MGTKQSPSAWCRAADEAFGDIPGCTVYMDDLLLHDATQEAHVKTIQTVLQRCKDLNIKLNAKKSFIGRDRVEYLGFIISSDGIRISESKVEKISKWKPPTKIEDIRSFLGLTNYFQVHIPRYAMLAGMLHKLTRKNSGYSGGEMPRAARIAFYKLKHALMASPVVRTADPDKPFVIMTDAATGDENNAGGIGGILMQEDDKGDHYVIAYESKSLNKAQEKYTPYMLEQAAIVHCLEKWCHYTMQNKVTIITDNNPTVHAASTTQKKTLNQLQAKLMEFDCTIVHKRGDKDFPADALSRLVHLGQHRTAAEPLDFSEVFDLSPKQTMPISAKSPSTFIPPTGVALRMLTEQEPWWSDLPQGLEPKSRLGQGINLSFEQSQDPVGNDILRFIMTGKSPDKTDLAPGFFQDEIKNFFISGDGILMRRDPTSGASQVFVPGKRVPELIISAHSSLIGGHMSRVKTLDRLKLISGSRICLQQSSFTYLIAENAKKSTNITRENQ